MRTYLFAYLAALATLAVLDAVWLGFIARDLYKDRLGPLLLDQPKWGVAILFYLVHIAGIVVFPLGLAGSWLSALLYGALFGAVVYSAYDVTNLATLRGWSATITVVDLLWGSFVSALSCLAAYLVLRSAA